MPASNELTLDILIEALETLNDGIAIYNADDQPILLNKVVRERFGHLYDAMAENNWSYAQALENAIETSMPEASPEKRKATFEKMLAAYHSGETYMAMTDKNEMVKITFADMANGLKASISVDVTQEHARAEELKVARAAAEAASASKSAFLANMSHEIRTPLNGIMGMAQVLENANLDDVSREHVATILESGKTLMTLLNDVLDLSKIEAGKFDIVPTDTDIVHVLRRIQKLWKPRAEEKGLELSLSFDCDIPNYISIDSVRLQQCISNLVSNAIKFTETGRVDVYARGRSLENGDHMIEIEISDTGAGMNEETLAGLFQPFKQADETISRDHGGTGLGLSITRKLAEMMGGFAIAKSQPGRGSTFSVGFRASPAKGDPRRRTTDAELENVTTRETLKASHLSVLLVDDHPINRQVAGLFLKPFNMRIVEAVNGKEALEALKTETFDLVLLDMHMPVMDGPTTIQHIRASGEDWAAVPVVALTADAMSGDKERYLAMGMDGYLAKPLAERDLLAEIMRVVSGKELADLPNTATG